MRLKKRSSKVDYESVHSGKAKKMKQDKSGESDYESVSGWESVESVADSNDLSSYDDTFEDAVDDNSIVYDDDLTPIRVPMVNFFKSESE